MFIYIEHSKILCLKAIEVFYQILLTWMIQMSNRNTASSQSAPKDKSLAEKHKNMPVW